MVPRDLPRDVVTVIHKEMGYPSGNGQWFPRAYRRAIDLLAAAAAPAAGAERSGEEHYIMKLQELLARVQEQRNSLQWALETIRDTFRRDMEQGYRTKDKEFAVEIAGRVLTVSAGATPTPDATITSTVERCAKVAEELPMLWDVEWLLTATKKDCSQRAAREIAAAIRALAPRSAAPTADGEVDNG